MQELLVETVIPQLLARGAKANHQSPIVVSPLAFLRDDHPLSASPNGQAPLGHRSPSCVTTDPRLCHDALIVLTLPISWLLLTTLDVAGFGHVVRCVRYTYRWLIERYHYTLKSGCGIEKLQLETAH